MTDSDLQKFFRSKLVPLQQTIAPLVSRNIDPNCESYFDSVLEPAPILSQEDIVASLMGIWQRQGLRTLLALEPDIRRMAKALRALDSQDHEISNFIYAMY